MSLLSPSGSGIEIPQLIAPQPRRASRRSFGGNALSSARSGTPYKPSSLSNAPQSNGLHSTASPPQLNKLHKSTSGLSQRSRTALLVLLFAIALGALYLVIQAQFATFSPEERQLLKFPRSMTDVYKLSLAAKVFSGRHSTAILIIYCSVYIVLQAFAIPGAIFLSVLAGPLFGQLRGLLIVSLVATTGATICYTVSWLLGQSLVEWAFPALLRKARVKIEDHRSNLFFYLLFLRISPLLPNWFISVSSPHLKVPYLPFVAATFLGLIPANYIHINTGLQLEELGDASNSGGGVKLQNLVWLLVIALLALIPTLFRGRFEKLDQQLAKHDTEIATTVDNATKAIKDVAAPLADELKQTTDQAEAINHVDTPLAEEDSSSTNGTATKRSTRRRKSTK